MVAGFLWEPISNVLIVSIMETALATSYPLHHLASALVHQQTISFLEISGSCLGVSFRIHNCM
jgi:hypothetical protein